MITLAQPHDDEIKSLLALIEAASLDLDEKTASLTHELEVSATSLAHMADRLKTDMEALEEGLLARLDHATGELTEEDHE
jgi:hypothetical protein